MSSLRTTRRPVPLDSPVNREEVAAQEAALVARVAAGDERAIEPLYERYGSSLYALGVRILGDVGAAEELVQETFLRLWRTAHRYDPERGRVSTYLFMMARSIGNDLRQSLSRSATSELHDAPADDPAYEQLIAGLLVRGALEGLSADQRKVLELAYDRGLTQREVSAELGLPLGTVKTRTFHALKALRAGLSERGVDV